MKSYLAYIRVSTQRQGVQGSSLQEQRSAIEAYASRNGLTITEWFEERETAAKSGRRVFRRMLNEARRKACGVIVHKIDRSARNLRDWVDFIDLMDKGLEVHLAHDAVDLSSRGGRLSADIQAVVAADFIRNLREETRKGFYGRLKQGLYPLGAPIGYLDRGRGKPKAIDPIKGPLVRLAFELYATGAHTFETLGDELYRRGLRGAARNRVSKNGLTTLLNNPFYIGLIHLRSTGEVFQGAHAPLVPKALYDRVQRVLRTGRLDGGSRHDFLFRKTILCRSCGRHLIGERQKQRYVYYRCHSPAHASISENRIEEAILTDLRYLMLTAEEVEDIRDFAREDIEIAAKAQAEEETALRLLIGKADDRLARLTDALVDGLIDKETFDIRKAGALKERVGLVERLSEASSPGTLQKRVAKNVELANTAYFQYENGDPFQKRELLKTLMSNFVASGNNVVFEPYLALRELIKYRKSNGCDHRRDECRTRARKTRVRKIYRIFKDAAGREEAAAKSLKSRCPHQDETDSGHRQLQASTGGLQEPV